MAGWLEMKGEQQLTFNEDDMILTGGMKYFIEEVSRGSLKIPHRSTFEFVKVGLCFMKKSKRRTCCRSRLINILSIMDNFFYNCVFESGIVFRRLSNVLLSGIQNLEKEKDKNNALYQTSIKRARLANWIIHVYIIIYIS